MSKRSDLLEYFQKQPQAAFHQGFTEKLHHELLENEIYEVHKYYLPVSIAKQTTWLRKYFKVLDRADIKPNCKRRNHWCEFGEEAFFILNRFRLLMEKGSTINAGSRHVSSLPWAVFGPYDPRRMVRRSYKNILAVADGYKNLIQGKCFPLDFHFRRAPDLPQKFADRYKTYQELPVPYDSPNFWMAVAICLTYDIIHNCGPDCPEVFELFTNDYRDTPETINIVEWQNLRCFILGIPGKVDFSKLKNPMACGRILDCEPGPARPVEPTKSKIEIKEISDSQDLESGETISPLYVKKSEWHPPMSPKNHAFDPSMFDLHGNLMDDVITGIGSHNKHHHRGLRGRIPPYHLHP